MEVLGVGTCVALGLVIAVVFGPREALLLAIAVGAAIGVSVGLLAHFGPHRRRKRR